MGFSSVSGLCLGVLSTRDYNTYFESLTWPSVHESITGIPTNPYIATAKTIAPEKKCQATFLSRFFWCSGASSGGQRTMDYLCFCAVCRRDGKDYADVCPEFRKAKRAGKPAQR